MPRLVALLLFTLLLSAQAAPAARLPEIQTAGSSQARAAASSNKETLPQPEAAAAPDDVLVADALHADQQGDPSLGETQ